MKRLLFAIGLMFAAPAFSNPQGVSPIPLGSVTPTLNVNSYCTVANPLSPVGTFVPYGNSTIDTSVSNTTNITQTDGTNTYVTTITTAASGVGSILTVPACAIKQ